MKPRYFIVCFNYKGQQSDTYVESFEGKYIGRNELFEVLNLDPKESAITNIIELNKSDFDEYTKDWK
jgi:hypothetical protein